MRPNVQLPNNNGNPSSAWTSLPSVAVASALRDIAFCPTEMMLKFDRHLDRVGEYFGLTVPRTWQSGTITGPEGAPLKYTWGSVDGRVTEYLMLSGSYNRLVLESMIFSLESIVKIETYYDMSIVLCGNE
jgi:hypothetical protein